jgi:hypothetical protein
VETSDLTFSARRLLPVFFLHHKAVRGNLIKSRLRFKLGNMGEVAVTHQRKHVAAAARKQLQLSRV